MLTPRLSTREALCTVATLFALAIWLPSAVAQPSDNEIFAAYCLSFVCSNFEMCGHCLSAGASHRETTKARRQAARHRMIANAPVVAVR